MAVADALLAVPRIVLLLVVAALWGPGAVTTIAVLAVTGWMGVARLVRAEVLGVRRRDFVDAARGSGAGGFTVVRVHVMGNVLGPIFVYATSLISVCMILASGLSFLGLGQQPPAPSWGSMLNAAQRFLTQAPWLAIFPGLAIFLVVLAFNLVGDGLRDALDPRSDRK